MTASTSGALLDLLRDSQILSPEELKRAENLIGNEADSKSAARRLLGSGLITQWQAGQLARSRPTLSLGKYVLLDRLPWGSSHAVFLAKHPMMERKVALSVLDRNSSSSTQAVSGFLKDARSIAGLDHRNLIHVFDVDQADDRYYQVMEYVQGRNLYEVIKEDGPMALEAAADLIRQLADGLEHAHRSGLTHGGLRPSNVILDGQGTAKIIDLGVAQLDDPVSAIHSDQEDSKILSIADFLSPEQAAGESPKAASDIYSLGCVGYWLLTGKVPFGEGDFQRRMQRHLTDEAPDVRDARSDVPPGLAEIILRMMAKKPGERYPTARNVVAALDKWWSDYAAQLEAAKPKPAPARPAAHKGKPAASGGKAASAGSNTKRSSPAGDDDTSIAPVIITSGKGGAKPAAKQPAKKPAAVAATGAAKLTGAGGFAAVDDDFSTPSSDEPPVDLASSAKPDRKSPSLLLLGVIGGALLLLGSAGTVAAYLIWSNSQGKDSTPVATKTGGDKSTSLKPPTTTDPPDGGASGNENPGSKDPPPDDEPALPEPGTGNEDPPDGGETTKPPDPPTQDPPPTDPPATDPPPTDPPAEPPKDPPPTEPPKDPPPTDPPKDPPKDPPPAGDDPFREFATAIDLPAIGGEGAAAQKLLGPVHLPADKICYIDLLGGDTVDPKAKRKFTLENARGGLAERDWEFKCGSEGEEGNIVATLSLGDKGLQFTWTPESVKIDVAPLLANCMLELRTSDHTRQVQLRTPIAGTALPIRFDRALIREKFDLPNSPSPKLVRVELIKLEGAEKVTFQPKQQLSADRDSTVVWVGEGDGKVLAFKVDSMMQKDLQLTLTPYITVGGAQPVKYNARQLTNMYATTVAASKQLTTSIAAMNQDATRYKDQIPKAQQQLDGTTKAIEQFDKLRKEMEQVGGKGFVQYRVYFAPDEEHKVILVEGTAPPPVEAPKGPREQPKPPKPAPEPKAAP